MTANWYQTPVSLAAYDVLWERLFGPQAEKPTVLDCESPGETDTERNRVRRQVDAELAGTLRPPDWLLAALARPDESYSLRWDADVPIRMLAARSGQAHVLGAIAPGRRPNSVAQEPMFWFGQTTEGRLREAVVERLPRQPPAKLRSVSVRLDSLAKMGVEVGAWPAEAHDRPVVFLRAQLRACGESDEASKAFAGLAAGRSAGRGELTVSVGRRWHTGHKIMVNDIDGRRYLVVTKDGFVTARGANAQELIDELRRELDDLNRNVAPRW